MASHTPSTNGSTVLRSGVFDKIVTHDTLSSTKTIDKTAKVTNRKPLVATVKGEVDEAWVKCMESEERSKLMRTLVRE